MEIEARLVPCLCPQCLNNQDGPGPNKEYSGNWIPYDLTTGRQITVDDYHNKCWGKLMLESTNKQMKSQKRK